ncbi:uncharacterized protein LOC126842594 isoform X2 [Adelges cooleyi]|nr:uncharacterized protein LOC126842594 isoform X2 [Adelges cooleyi]
MKGVASFICAASCLCSIQVAHSVQDQKTADSENTKSIFLNDQTSLTDLEKIIMGLKYPFIGPVSKDVSPALGYDAKFTDNILPSNSKTASTEVPDRIAVFSSMKRLNSMDSPKSNVDDNGIDLPELMNALTSMLQ